MSSESCWNLQQRFLSSPTAYGLTKQIGFSFVLCPLKVHVSGSVVKHVSHWGATRIHVLGSHLPFFVSKYAGSLPFGVRAGFSIVSRMTYLCSSCFLITTICTKVLEQQPSIILYPAPQRGVLWSNLLQFWQDLPGGAVPTSVLTSDAAPSVGIQTFAFTSYNRASHYCFLGSRK